ncbi:hypothetical protein [Bacillus mycoides]|uniref:hypothetical protein n=1 Tax=Bacillus mycoides TaxID=1405 RepID=UPI003D1E1F6B
MKLEIVVCYSILKECFESLDALDRTNKSAIIFDEIMRRKIILNDQLQDSYEEYFRDTRPDLLDVYMQFIVNAVQSVDNVKVIGSTLENPTNLDEYIDVLIDMAIDTEDKILLTDLLHPKLTTCQFSGINKLDSDNIFNKKKENILSKYRLPIIRKCIQRGQPNLDLAEWLSRFWRSESEFIVIDNYIYENRAQFLSYFLNYIPKGTTIHLYTMLNHGNTEQNLKSVFRGTPYSDWNFKFNIIGNKKDQHARDIFTNQYYIEIDKGMGVFGRNGRTDQSNITIQYKDNITDSTMPRARELV